jgi:hypothetical protein
MVEYKKYTRNSLQNRLERSRRHRSRGGNHHDGVSIGDESIASVDNASTASASIDPTIQSKHEDSIKRDSIRKVSIKADAIREDIPNLADSASPLGQDVHFSRRQRLTQRSLKSKRTGPPQSPPTQVEARINVNSSEIKMSQNLQRPVSTVQVASSQAVARNIFRADAVKKSAPEKIQTQEPQEPKDLDQDAPSRRQFQSPKHQIASPCESVAYQASAMEEDCEMREKTRAVVHPPSRKRTETLFSNRGASALQNWKQRERKEHKLESSAGTSTPVPKIVHGLAGDRYGSSTSCRRSVGRTGQETDTTEQVSSRKTKDSGQTPMHVTSKSTLTVKESTCVRQPSQTLQLHCQRKSTGGNNTASSYPRSSPSHQAEGSLYKNILKPVSKDPPVDGSSNPTQETAFGGVIETPKRVKVSSLLASFDSRQNQPLMPMNCGDPRVRHSLPFGYSVRKKSSNDLPRQAQQQHDVDQVEQSRKVVCTPRRSSISISNQIAVSPHPPVAVDKKTVQSTESASHNLKSAQSEISSPTREGVAERYKSVTGRSNQEPEPEIHMEDDEVENIKTKKLHRTKQYYKASWRVHTNDFDEEKKFSEAADRDRGTLSPRQSVLSSWNQRYQKQVQASSNMIGCTPNGVSSTEHDGTNYPNHRTKSSSQHLEKIEGQDIEHKRSQGSQSTQDVERQQSQASQDSSGVQQEPSHVLYLGRQPMRTEMAAKASIFSTWQKRERAHQSVAKLSDRKFESSYEARETDDIHGIGRETSVPETETFGESEEAPRTRRSGQKTIHDSANHILQGEVSDLVPERIGLSTLRRNVPKNEMPRDRRPSLDSASKSNGGIDDAKDTIVGNSSHESLGQKVGNYGMKDGVVKSSWSDTTSENQEESSSQQDEKKTLKNNDRHSSGHPWEKSTKRNVVQSWKLRSYETKKDSRVAEEAREKSFFSSKFSSEAKHKVGGLDSGRVPPFNSTEILDEKKSEDLSVNEDRILGVDYDDDPMRNRTRTNSSIANENSFDPGSSSPRLMYDDDSYITDGGNEKDDKVSSEILLFPPKPTKTRSHGSSTDLKNNDSGEISLYVEDEFTKKLKSMTFTDVQMEDEKTEGIKDVAHANSTFQESPASKQGSMRIHPSPKDTKKYRHGYFGDESISTPRGSQNIDADPMSRQGKKTFESTNKLTKTSRRRSDALDVWAVSSVSEDDLDDDIQFDGTEEWLARDPDINDDAIDDSSILSEPNQYSEESSKPSFRPTGKVFQKAETTTFPNSQSRENDARATNRKDVGIPVLNNPNTWTGPKQAADKNTHHKKNASSATRIPFDPFHDEADDGTKEYIPPQLFSPTRDPFMTEESFSPLDWSSPRGTTAQHIGYYNSPDSRLEI